MVSFTDKVPFIIIKLLFPPSMLPRLLRYGSIFLFKIQIKLLFENRGNNYLKKWMILVLIKNLFLSPLEKVKIRVSIQNMPTFCHATLSIEMSTRIKYTM